MSIVFSDFSAKLNPNARVRKGIRHIRDIEPILAGIIELAEKSDNRLTHGAYECAVSSDEDGRYFIRFNCLIDGGYRISFKLDNDKKVTHAEVYSINTGK